ncbi:MAG: SMC-Scp complex subunit ScpB [Planctomycetes bacterium]|nr:SMC-Scp complex subunit ScpB [Planctomycetota bacterium]
MRVREDLVVTTNNRFGGGDTPEPAAEPTAEAPRVDSPEVAEAKVEAPAELVGEGVVEERTEAASPEVAAPDAAAPEASVLEEAVPEVAFEPVAEPLAAADLVEAEVRLETTGDTHLEVDRAEDGLAQGDDAIDAAAAAAAVADEAGVAEIEEELLPDEEGLPPVPELTDAAEVAKVIYVLMLTSREGLSVLRLAQSCNTTQKLVEQALELLQQNLRGLGLPVELARNGDTVKWMSGASAFPYLQRLRGVKKQEKLSPAALETLAVIAYRQPVMRSEIEAIRGVKAGPMLRTLLQHKLVKMTGRAEVPGRPLQYGTTQQFLERFGLASLHELPSIKEWKNLG